MKIIRVFSGDDGESHFEEITAEEMAEHLVGEYDSSFEFVAETDREDQFTTHIVEVDDKGKDIVSPQTRNKSESKS